MHRKVLTYTCLELKTYRFLIMPPPYAIRGMMAMMSCLSLCGVDVVFELLDDSLVNEPVLFLLRQRVTYLELGVIALRV